MIDVEIGSGENAFLPFLAKKQKNFTNVGPFFISCGVFLTLMTEIFFAVIVNSSA